MVQDRDTPVRRLGQLIDRNRAEIERRWLERVLEGVSHTPGVELTHLRDGLPDYLRELAATFSEQGGAELGATEPAWSKVAREHGITRVRIGFDINQLIQEFIILRRVIREVAAEHGLAEVAVEAVLADFLDGAIAASVSAYVDARDYLARQKQAENISFLTHELRNPLSTATLAAELLRRQATPEQLQLLDRLDRNQTRLAELIDSVLLTGKLEAGKIECRPVDVSLKEVMEPALEAARVAASHKGVEFRANYDPELRLRVDPALTRSAIQNLADNAAKYTDHGEVSIAVDASPEACVIHVRDSCEGISEAELRTIFEPYERGTTRKSGTGLGLAIARRAAEVQGGSIHAESNERSGCHFWIRLPRRGHAAGEQ
jgi:signal transduction histidine kinase